MDEGSEVDTVAVSSSKLTDVGNGHRFVEAYQGVVRWLIDEQEWRIWQGTHWRPYNTDEIPIAMAKQVSAMIFTEAERAESEEEIKILKKWAKQSLNSERLSAMIRMVKADHRIWGSYEEFDRDPYLLNFTNGTVDLRTGAIKGHDPADKISCLVPHDYNPYTPAPMWHKLVTRCTDCDRSGETPEYLLRFLGYALLGRNVEQKLSLIVGAKQTGKSKALDVQVLGPDYAIISQPKLITRSKWATTHHDSETWSTTASS
jgi:putative DNA primase/helicase